MPFIPLVTPSDIDEWEVLVVTTLLVLNLDAY